MNNETHEDRVKILTNGASIGAIMVDSSNCYYRFSGDYLMYRDVDEWIYLPNSDDIYEMRSLSDIQQLVDKQDENENLKSCIKGIIQAHRDNSGYEPSLSVFQREISEAEELINE